TDRTFRLDGDAVTEREQALDLVDHLVELLVAAEDDVFLLEIGRELHRHKGVDTGRTDVVIAPLRPRILTAADRTVADMDHVLDRPPHHALRSGISASADRHHARDRFDVGFDLTLAGYLAVFGRCFLFAGRFGDGEMLAPALSEFLGISRQYFFDQLFVEGTVVLVFGAHSSLRVQV